MAFNFFGTFTTAQLEMFRRFSKLQEQDIKKRIAWLNFQILRVGVFSTEYDDTTGFPVSFQVSPLNSYGAKLLQAYKILGGIPEQEMLLRTSDKPVFLTRGPDFDYAPGDTTGGYSDEYSNMRRNRGSQRFDRDIGLIVDRMKFWQLEAIKRKREKLEFKIKRTLDYSDQIQTERDFLTAMLDPENRNNLDNIYSSVIENMLKTGAHNVVEDDSDIFGLGIGKIKDYTVESPEQEKDTGER